MQRMTALSPNYLKSEMLKDCTLVLVQNVEARNTTLKTTNVQKSSVVAPLLRFISINDSPKCRYNFIRYTDTRKTSRNTATNSLLFGTKQLVTHRTKQLASDVMDLETN
jgi:hypothetical protein